MTGESLVGWRLYGEGICAEITAFQDGKYHIAFLPRRGRDSVPMSLPELLRYKARYDARFINMRGSNVFELKRLYAA